MAPLSGLLPPPAVLAGLSFKELTAYIDQMPAAEVARKTPNDLLTRTEQWDKEATASEALSGPGSKETLLIAYLSFCHYFYNTRAHPGHTNAKKDAAFRARFEKLKPLYETRRVAAGQIKTTIAAEPSSSSSTPGTSHATRTTTNSAVGASAHRSSPPVDNEAGGSIAERLKALRGSGMDVGSSASASTASKRVSREIASPATTAATAGSPATTSPTSPPPAPTTMVPIVRRPVPGPNSPPAVHPSGPRHQRGSSTSSLPRASSTHSFHDLAHDVPNGGGSPSAAAPPQLSPDKASAPHLSPSTSPRIHHLPPIPDRPPQRTSVSSQASDSGVDLDKFEKVFPSVDNFDKQFDNDGFAIPAVPTEKRNGKPAVPLPDPPKQPPVEDNADADFPLFPSLPSVPTDIPGQRRPSVSSASGRPPLPPPPAPIEKSDIVPSPPSPDLLSDLKRPASTPATHDPLASSLSISPPDAAAKIDGPSEFASSNTEIHPDSPQPSHPPESTPHAQSHPAPSPPVPRRPDFYGSTPAADTQPVKFPAAQPTPPPVPTQSGAMPVKAKRPDFPLSMTITPELLRSYFLNLSVDILLLDVRPEDEFQRGYVGHQYVDRGCRINVVWIDPTILMRDGLNSVGLEDALSVSPEAQRLAFENRAKYDLCVIYDTRSTRFPKRGEPPTAAGRLFDIISEHEFVKPLPRFPALLIGGYEGWCDFVKQRQMVGLQEHQRALQRQAAKATPNGHTSTQSLSDANYKLSRQPHLYKSSYAKGITDNFNPAHPQSMSGSISSPPVPPMPSFHHSSSSFSGGSYGGSNYYSTPTSPYSVPTPPARSNVASPPVPSRPTHMATSSMSSYHTAQPPIAPPPRASIHPGAGTRRQSSYDNQQYSGAFSGPHRPSIDYPQAHALAQVPQPPPVAASHSLERVDRLPQTARTTSLRATDQLTANSGVRYWSNSKLGITGLKNLGNTCYMNSTIQCLSATFPFARYFLDGRYKRDINIYNNLGTRGDLAHAFAELLGALWGENYTFLSPITFRKSIIKFKSDFAGTEQHDSQEFLSFVMDGLHEDLNRIKVRPKPIEMTPEREAALETLPPQIASDKEWQIYKMRNDSFIVDLFQGQYMNRMECLTCHKTSTVYDSFQWLTLDLPSSKSHVNLTELFDRWVRPEILDGDEKWYCPRCKVNRRASKTLTLVRLPPVLLIQLKRFIPVSGGRFWNKSETSVNFPLEGLDLTRYVPPRQPTGAEDMDDPRTQIGPFRYDLYGVSNHMGTLSSGHYTAYVRSGDQWIFCDDSRFTPARREDVMSRPGYILFYKRVM